MHSSALSTLIAATAALVAILLLNRQRPRRIVPGSSVLITGGSRGIGLSLANIFSRAKCHIYLVARSAESLEAAAVHCRKLGAASVHTIAIDLSTPDGVDTLSAIEDIKYLVLNAGMGGISAFDNSLQSFEICNTLINVNYLSNVRLIQKYLTSIEKNHGSILVISSLAGVVPSCLRAAYTASKHAMQGFCSALRMELTNASLTVVSPGFVDTEFHARVLKVKAENHSGAASAAAPGHKRKNAMTPAQVADIAIDAMEAGKAEVVLSLAGKLAYTFRPILTTLVDRIAKKKALDSLKH